MLRLKSSTSGFLWSNKNKCLPPLFGTVNRESCCLPKNGSILSAPPLNDMNKATLIRQLRNDKRDWEYLTSRNQDIGGETKLTIAELKRQIREITRSTSCVRRDRLKQCSKFLRTLVRRFFDASVSRACERGLGVGGARQRTSGTPLGGPHEDPPNFKVRRA